MATRFAGDFFGVPLSIETDQSELVKYFPGLGDTYKYAKKSEGEKQGPRLTGNLRGAQAFAGFKLFETPK